MSVNKAEAAEITRRAALAFVDDPHDKDELRALLEHAITLDPQNTEARFWLAGVLYFDFVDWEGACEILQEALRIEPDRADCLLFMASALEILKRPPQEYLPFLQKAARLEPEWVAPHLALAVPLAELGRVAEAEKELELAVSLQDTAPETDDRIEDYYERVATGRKGKIEPLTISGIRSAITKARWRNRLKTIRRGWIGLWKKRKKRGKNGTASNYQLRSEPKNVS